MPHILARFLGVELYFENLERAKKFYLETLNLNLSDEHAGHHARFDSGESFDLAAEYLRVRSPSAEVQGHSPSERRTVGGKEAVQILEVHPVGNYAVRLTFDDMHSTGIFSWEYLFELGQNREKYWRDYIDELAEKGLSRASAKH